MKALLPGSCDCSEAFIGHSNSGSIWNDLEAFFLRNKGSAQNQLFPSWGDVENYHWPMCVNPWELQFLVCSVSHGVSFPSLPTPAWGAGSHCCRSYRIPCPAACSGTFLFNINMPLCKAPSDKTGLRAFRNVRQGYSINIANEWLHLPKELSGLSCDSSVTFTHCCWFIQANGNTLCE